MQVRLQNLIGRTSLVGQIVKMVPGNPKAYKLADLTDHEAIGTVAQSVPFRNYGLVNLINTVAWSDVGNPPSRIVTDDTTELTTDYNITCNKATAMEVTLLAATGSNRVREIANIGVGDVTVTSDGTDTIDDETSQTVSWWENMVIHDYELGKWKIK